MVDSVVMMCYNVIHGGDFRMIERRKRNSFVETVVRGVRADSDFWSKCDLIAKSEKTTRNELIVRVVSEYCEKVVLDSGK